MPRVSRSEIPKLVRARKPFQGSSMIAYYRDNDQYVIRYLDVVLAIVEPNGTVLHANPDKLNKRASRYYELIKSALN